MLIKGGSEHAQGMFSKFGIRTVHGEGNIHMSNREKREAQKQKEQREEVLRRPHYSTEDDGMVSLVLPGLREAIAKVE